MATKTLTNNLLAFYVGSGTTVSTPLDMDDASWVRPDGIISASFDFTDPSEPDPSNVGASPKDRINQPHSAGGTFTFRLPIEKTLGTAIELLDIFFDTFLTQNTRATTTLVSVTDADTMVVTSATSLLAGILVSGESANFVTAVAGSDGADARQVRPIEAMTGTTMELAIPFSDTPAGTDAIETNMQWYMNNDGGVTTQKCLHILAVYDDASGQVFSAGLVGAVVNGFRLEQANGYISLVITVDAHWYTQTAEDTIAANITGTVAEDITFGNIGNHRALAEIDIDTENIRMPPARASRWKWATSQIGVLLGGRGTSSTSAATHTSGAAVTPAQPTASIQVNDGAALVKESRLFASDQEQSHLGYLELENWGVECTWPVTKHPQSGSHSDMSSYSRGRAEYKMSARGRLTVNDNNISTSIFAAASQNVKKQFQVQLEIGIPETASAADGIVACLNGATVTGYSGPDGVGDGEAVMVDLEFTGVVPVADTTMPVFVIGQM